MPLINGQKMACEPCIRGHRSTKCTHANERLMVPVRKPGRPLSTCPHPPTRGCGCGGGVTAAIPRKQKCNCGPSSSTEEVDKTIKVESPASIEAIPTSPTKTTAPGAPYRVQKASAKANSRKPSFGPANLERLDASQVNILPPFDHSQASVSHLNGGPLLMGTPTPRPSMDFGQIPLMGSEGLPFQMYQPMVPQSMVSPASQRLGAMSLMPMPQATTPPTATKAVAVGGSCCSTPPASTESSPKAESKPKAGSCCASKKQPPLQATALPEPSTTTTNGVPKAANGLPMSPYQTGVMGPQIFPSYMPHPTLFTYPAHYGSFMSPLQPQQWKQTMEAMQYGQPVPPLPNYDAPTPFAYNATVSVGTNGHNGSADGVTSHMCTCGEGCQCVGCAAHPYNDATQDYVRSAWQSMVDEAYTNGHGVNGDGVHGSIIPNGNGSAHHSQPSFSAEPESAVSEKPNSPPAPDTPSEGTSGVHEELSASDFFFVNYHFGADSCSGETASCPCGDECQCLGCSIHNNQGPYAD
ncbi:grisea protein [Plectosphaerella plurivora]|uniref:Grisea protein n=1 Tax=Plectosphaerella plurivora TaxID=936078 RepID=A0A9P8VNH9_9PEZI|nr:grisea protein [Plectosphaerella plurivora]